MPVTDLTDRAVIQLVADAVTAPSMHNAQPWKFVFDRSRGVISLLGDPERAMAHTDPDHRALHLGCAAALFNLRVSAAWRGWGVRVALLPDDSVPWLLATVRITGPQDAADAVASLRPALVRRRSSRRPLSDEPVSAELLDGLSAAARWEGCHLAIPGSWHVETLLELMRDAEHREFTSPQARSETAAWTTGAEDPADARADGIPAAAFGPRSSGRLTAVRDFGQVRPVPQRPWEVFERRPQLLLLGTSGDSRTDWMLAGQGLERVLLRATADGLATSMTSQPLEWSELRWVVRDPGAAMGHVHMVVRVGYGPEGVPTPRRRVADVLEIR